MTIDLKLLGIGAAEFRFGSRKVYIDAFNDFNPAPELNRGDLVLFTHNDSDHFSAGKLASSLFPETEVIGPPGIAHALWSTGMMQPEQLRVVYPQEIEKPAELKWNDLSITIFQTEHFIGWHTPHISFLFQWQGKRIFFTGDSSPNPAMKPTLENLDGLVMSLMVEKVTKDMIDRKKGRYLMMNKILNAQQEFSPKLLIGNHVIKCGWTIPAEDLNSIIKSEGFADIIIPETAEEVVRI